MIETAGPLGERSLPITSFFTGFYETALEPGAIVKGVRVPRLSRWRGRRLREVLPALGGGQAADRCRCARRPRAGRGDAETSASRWPARRRRRSGPAAPRPCCEARRLSDGAIRAAADAAAAESDPLSDLMGSAQYRREMVRVWTRRLLTVVRDRAPSRDPLATGCTLMLVSSCAMNASRSSVRRVVIRLSFRILPMALVIAGGLLGHAAGAQDGLASRSALDGGPAPPHRTATSSTASRRISISPW